MHYKYIHNNSVSHVCHTHIKCIRERENIPVFTLKVVVATISFSANAILGLFEGGYYSKCIVYSRKYDKRGRAQPSVKARAVVYGSETQDSQMLVIEGTMRVGGLNITDAGQTRTRRVTWHVCRYTTRSVSYIYMYA